MAKRTTIAARVADVDPSFLPAPTPASPAEWFIGQEGCPEVLDHGPRQLLVHHPEGDSQLQPVGVRQPAGSHLVCRAREELLQGPLETFHCFSDIRISPVKSGFTLFRVPLAPCIQGVTGICSELTLG